MDYNNLCPGCFDDSSGQNPCPTCGYSSDSNPGAGLYLTPGTLLFNKYLVGRVLGQGGFGITYLGWDANLDIRIAIKEFFPQGLVSRVPGENSVISYTGEIKDQFSFGVESFLREAKTLARFENHPNIVTVRDFFKENNTAYMVMSFIEGITLLEHLNRSGGRIPVEQAVQIIMPVLDALREVHRADIMHRDISPDNIFIDREGRITLIDFGAARQEMREKSKSLSVILKAGYAPEEQYRSKGKQGPWTDIYAVGATLYRSITGETPPEAMDRLDEDDLIPPSQLGVELEPKQEQALLKALAVKARNRYQAVEEFQDEIVASPARSQVSEGYAGVRPKEATGLDDKDDIKSSKAEPGQKAQIDVQAELAKEPEKKPEPAEKPAGWSPQEAPAYSISKKTVKTATLVLLSGLLIFGAVILFSDDDEVFGPAGPATGEPAQTYDPAIIAALDANYYIDYENGTIPIGDLPIGSKVVDPCWEWEFRAGQGYARKEGDQTKPVTWIVVSKDHYEGLEPHVTLLSEELIGRYVFSAARKNHWGESDLRSWLNSAGFYRAFSEGFKNAVLTTNVPNKKLDNGSAYSTQDKVFIPSTTELGDTNHSRTYQIGSAYPYFQGAGDAKRVARLGNETWLHWTRSPASLGGGYVRLVATTGAFSGSYLSFASYDIVGVRPALNLKADTLVSKISD